MSETTRDIVIKVQAQQGRIASELESEKKVRADSHARINEKLTALDERIRKAEIRLAIAIGIALAFQTAVSMGYFSKQKYENNNPVPNSNHGSMSDTNQLRYEATGKLPGFTPGLFGFPGTYK